MADTYSQPNLITPADSSLSAGAYPMIQTGIVWPGESDKYQTTRYSPNDVVPPPYWIDRYPNGYTEDNFPDLHADEHFQVWMRTAGLPTFRLVISLTKQS